MIAIPGSLTAGRPSLNSRNRRNGGRNSVENSPYKLPCLPIHPRAESWWNRLATRKVTFCRESVRRTLRCRSDRLGCSSPFRGANPRCFAKIRFSRPDRSLRCRSRPSAGLACTWSAGPAGTSERRTRRPRISTPRAFSGASTPVSRGTGGCRNSPVPAPSRRNPCRPEGSRNPPDRSPCAWGSSLRIVLGDRPWGSRSRSEARAGVGALCLHRRTHHSARAHAGKVRRRRACLRPAAPFGRRQERTGTPRTGTPRTQALRGHRHSEDTGTPRTQALRGQALRSVRRRRACLRPEAPFGRSCSRGRLRPPAVSARGHRGRPDRPPTPRRRSPRLRENPARSRRSTVRNSEPPQAGCCVGCGR